MVLSACSCEPATDRDLRLRYPRVAAACTGDGDRTHLGADCRRRSSVASGEAITGRCAPSRLTLAEKVSGDLFRETLLQDPPEKLAVVILWQPSGIENPDVAWRFVSGEMVPRSEEHTSELQSLRHLVCRLLL